MSETVSQKLVAPGLAPETSPEQEEAKGFRAKLKSVLESTPYEVFQAMATIGSIAAEPVLTYASEGKISPETLRGIDYTFAGVFLANTIGKTFSSGFSHWKKTEAYIDASSALAIAAASAGIDLGNPRIIRLMKSITKLMRLGKIRGIKKSLEDETMEDINENEMRTMMIIFAILAPAMGDFFGNLDYTDIKDVLTEMGIYAGVGGAMAFGAKSNRKSLHNKYTQGFERIGLMYDEFLEANPEIIVAKDRVKDALTKSGDVAENEIEDVFKKMFEQMSLSKHLANPPGEVMETDEHGLKPKSLDAVVMATDLRNFTALSEVLGDDIFDQLNNNYYSFLQALARHYGGKRFSFAGDAIFIYFTDTEIENAEGVKKSYPKEKLALKCGQVMNDVTNTMAAIWRSIGEKHGLVSHDHFTGIGFAMGKIRIGDALSFGKVSDHPMIAEIHEATRSVLKNYPWSDIDSQRSEIASLVGIAGPINHAARLESQTKTYPDYNCLIPDYMYEKMPEDWKVQFEELGEQELKGIDRAVKIYGMKRFR